MSANKKHKNLPPTPPTPTPTPYLKSRKKIKLSSPSHIASSPLHLHQSSLLNSHSKSQDKVLQKQVSDNGSDGGDESMVLCIKNTSEMVFINVPTKAPSSSSSSSSLKDKEKVKRKVEEEEVEYHTFMAEYTHQVFPRERIDVYVSKSESIKLLKLDNDSNGNDINGDGDGRKLVSLRVDVFVDAVDWNVESVDVFGVYLDEAGEKGDDEDEEDEDDDEEDIQQLPQMTLSEFKKHVVKSFTVSEASLQSKSKAKAKAKPKPKTKEQTQFHIKLNTLPSEYKSTFTPVVRSSSSTLQSQASTSDAEGVAFSYVISTIQNTLLPPPTSTSQSSKSKSKSTVNVNDDMKITTECIAHHHNTVQKLAPYFIETGDESDLSVVGEEGFWSVVYIHGYTHNGCDNGSEGEGDDGEEGGKRVLVGYATFYNFYDVNAMTTTNTNTVDAKNSKSKSKSKAKANTIVKKEEEKRVKEKRLCQFLILPPYQRNGLAKAVINRFFDDNLPIQTQTQSSPTSRSSSSSSSSSSRKIISVNNGGSVGGSVGGSDNAIFTIESPCFNMQVCLDNVFYERFQSICDQGFFDIDSLDELYNALIDVSHNTTDIDIENDEDDDNDTVKLKASISASHAKIYDSKILSTLSQTMRIDTDNALRLIDVYFLYKLRASLSSPSSSSVTTPRSRSTRKNNENFFNVTDGSGGGVGDLMSVVMGNGKTSGVYYTLIDLVRYRIGSNVGRKVNKEDSEKDDDFDFDCGGDEDEEEVGSNASESDFDDEDDEIDENEDDIEEEDDGEDNGEDEYILDCAVDDGDEEEVDEMLQDTVDIYTRTLKRAIKMGKNRVTNWGRGRVGSRDV